MTIQAPRRQGTFSSSSMFSTPRIGPDTGFVPNQCLLNKSQKYFKQSMGFLRTETVNILVCVFFSVVIAHCCFSV